MKDAAALFRALGDEIRVQMLWLLLNRPELCVCDFIEVLGIPQPKASRHLRVLLGAGLVENRKEGQWRFYSLRPEGPALTGEQIAMLKTVLGSRPGAAELLERLPERTLGYSSHPCRGTEVCQ